MHRYTHITKIHKTFIKNVIVILILPQALNFFFFLSADKGVARE